MPTKTSTTVEEIVRKQLASLIFLLAKNCSGIEGKGQENEVWQIDIHYFQKEAEGYLDENISHLLTTVEGEVELALLYLKDDTVDMRKSAERTLEAMLTNLKGLKGDK